MPPTAPALVFELSGHEAPPTFLLVALPAEAPQQRENFTRDQTKKLTSLNDPQVKRSQSRYPVNVLPHPAVIATRLAGTGRILSSPYSTSLKIRSPSLSSRRKASGESLWARSAHPLASSSSPSSSASRSAA